MDQNSSKKDSLVKIKFKGSRREFFRNTMEFPIQDGDTMIVEADRGEDLGRARINPCKALSTEDSSIAPILRKADRDELSQDSENRSREEIALKFCIRRIKDLNLPMKLIDVEYRLDRKKIIFYFTADDRIDFRELVKILAAEYKTRIEMRQISTREETKKIGGVGSCGKTLCCQSFLDDFEPISTQLVKEQNLPMNPSKISGTCGKLKCCYRYEHDLYDEVLSRYPGYGSRVEYEGKTGIIEKIDIFQKVVTIRFSEEDFDEHPLSYFDDKIKPLNSQT